MITVEDAIKTLRNTGRILLQAQANQIADLIEHLQSKCDLEVNEVLRDGD